MIIFNFKNYLHGKDSFKLAKIIEKNCPGSIICVSAFDVAQISKDSNLRVFVQHLDFFEGERDTGFLLARAAKKAGAIGAMLNHSEHKLFSTQLEKTISVCKKEGLLTLVCVSSLTQLNSILHLEPWAIAYEDSNLISTGKSITEYNTLDVKKFVAVMRTGKSLAICGAGISKAEDVKEALEIGCDGVLIASAVAANKKPEKLLKELSKFS